MSAGTALKQVVTFRLGVDLFASDIFSVERVLRQMEPRSIPNVPDWIEGVVDYQSRVVPVVDLRKRFELSDRSTGGAVRLVIFSIEGEFVGGIVDEVLDVMQVAPGALSPPPPMFKGLSAEFLVGVLRRADRLVVVVDIARIFSTNERLVLEGISGESEGG